jgi:hypothetical protein
MLTDYFGRDGAVAFMTAWAGQTITMPSMGETEAFARNRSIATSVHKNPSPDNVHRLADLYNLSVDQIGTIYHRQHGQSIGQRVIEDRPVEAGPKPLTLNAARQLSHRSLRGLNEMIRRGMLPAPIVHRGVTLWNRAAFIAAMARVPAGFTPFPATKRTARTVRRAASPRPVSCFESGESFPSAQEAARWAGVADKATIQFAIRTGGEAAGLHWYDSRPDWPAMRQGRGQWMQRLDSSEVFTSAMQAARAVFPNRDARHCSMDIVAAAESGCDLQGVRFRRISIADRPAVYHLLRHRPSNP